MLHGEPVHPRTSSRSRPSNDPGTHDWGRHVHHREQSPILLHPRRHRSEHQSIPPRAWPGSATAPSPKADPPIQRVPARSADGRVPEGNAAYDDESCYRIQSYAPEYESYFRNQPQHG
ncbi:hypothetical protein EVA_12651 [gut metagenome]|uniref:Uncharacterized protein n=1 Tax=gut metagenome TaxID=749906 RepID=J9GBV6_9ZZZZ